MTLEKLRSRNTEVCVELVREGLEAFRRADRFQSAPQRRRGRYFSYMPARLKNACMRTFAHHAGGGS